MGIGLTKHHATAPHSQLHLVGEKGRDVHTATASKRRCNCCASPHFGTLDKGALSLSLIFLSCCWPQSILRTVLQRLAIVILLLHLVQEVFVPTHNGSQTRDDGVQGVSARHGILAMASSRRPLLDVVSSIAERCTHRWGCVSRSLRLPLRRLGALNFAFGSAAALLHSLAMLKLRLEMSGAKSKM